MFFFFSLVNCCVHSGVHPQPWRSDISLALGAEIKGYLFSASLRFCCLMASHLQWCMAHWIILLSIWIGEYRIKHLGYSVQLWPVMSLMSVVISMMKQVVCGAQSGWCSLGMSKELQDQVLQWQTPQYHIHLFWHGLNFTFILRADFRQN